MVPAGTRAYFQIEDIFCVHFGVSLVCGVNYAGAADDRQCIRDNDARNTILCNDNTFLRDLAA